MLGDYTPLNISKKALFAPANGQLYTNHDFKRCYSQQPLFVMPSYLWAKDCHEFDPPTLYFGYDIGEKKALAIIRKHFDKCIVWGSPGYSESDDEEDGEDEDEDDTEETAEQSDDDDEDEDEEAEEAEERLVPHAACRHMIAVELFLRKNGEPVWGLSLGSNYTGLVPARFVPPILELFQIPATDKGMWYLDAIDWRWLPKEC
ncbi:hypothetical protein OF83DRAFT_1139869 [Amylostereum chailletii]|nr:hypothetical protein OF83DRAFT_1139869 [Amylostereum chailletii]